ncbi:MAG: hypothetical protein NVS3B3_21450 [Aquirhabdus sp.]
MNKQDLFDVLMGAAVVGLAFVAYKQSIVIKQLTMQATPIAKAAQGIWAGDITAGATGVMY